MPTNLPFQTTLEPSQISHPFELVNNTIEYDFVDEESCHNIIYGTIIAFDNQAVIDNVIVSIEVYLEGGNDRSASSIWLDTDNLVFSIAPIVGRRYNIWLRNWRTGDDLSQHVHIDLSGCDLGIARLNFIQVGDW